MEPFVLLGLCLIALGALLHLPAFWITGIVLLVAVVAAQLLRIRGETSREGQLLDQMRDAKFFADDFLLFDGGRGLLAVNAQSNTLALFSASRQPEYWLAHQVLGAEVIEGTETIVSSRGASGGFMVGDVFLGASSGRSHVQTFTTGVWLRLYVEDFRDSVRTLPLPSLGDARHWYAILMALQRRPVTA